MKTKLIAFLLFAFCAKESLSQDYNIKEGGAQVVTIVLFGQPKPVNYQGQYIKKLNDEKGFFPHGKGSFYAYSGDNKTSYSGDFFEGRITGLGNLIVNNMKYEGQLLDGFPSGEGTMTWTGSSVEGFAAVKGNFTKGIPDGQVRITYSSGNIYEGMVKAGKLNGQGKLIYVDGSKKSGTIGPQKIAFAYYEGEFVNNMREGVGITYYKNGEKLEGQWEKDLFNGYGTATEENGLKYTGNWKSGNYNGQGRLDYADGSFYVGQWLKGRRNGKGVFTSATGLKQEGDWSNDKYSGVGEVIYSSGATYKGALVNDVFEGQGIYVFADGTVLEGTFSADKLIEGEQRNPDGTYSIGTWDKDGVFRGKRKAIATNKSIWEGEWEGGFPIGSGKVIYENGNIYEGEWMGYTVDNAGYYGIRGLGKMIYPSLGIYEGKFFENEPEGNGILTYNNGDVYEGDWKKSLKSGYGKMTYSNGDVYDGAWENNAKNGFGTMVYVANSSNDDFSDVEVKSYEGMWKNDLPNGTGTMVYKNGKTDNGEFRAGVFAKPFACKSVTIGTQVWSAENLTVTTFRNGDPILEAKSRDQWYEACDKKVPAYCFFNNDPTTAKTKGVIYNFYAVLDQRGLAPEGWKIPSFEEAKALGNFINADMIRDANNIESKKNQGINTSNLEEAFSDKYSNTKNPNMGVNKLKANDAWEFPGSNSTGFNARISGHRDINGVFYCCLTCMWREVTYWTSSYSKYSGEGFGFKIFDYYSITYDEVQVSAGFAVKEMMNTYGYPVRLLKR